MAKKNPAKNCQPPLAERLSALAQAHKGDEKGLRLAVLDTLRAQMADDRAAARRGAVIGHLRTQCVQHGEAQAFFIALMRLRQSRQALGQRRLAVFCRIFFCHFGSPFYPLSRGNHFVDFI